MRSIFFVLIMVSIIQVSAANPIEVNSVITVANLNPADRNVEIQLILQNTESDSINNVKVYLFLNYPFSASIPPNTKTGEIIDPGYLIGAGQMEDEYTPSFDLASRGSRTTLFKIDVDRNAKYGSYDIPYTIFYDYFGSKQYNGKITVKISGNTLVDITNVTIDSKNNVVEPGDVFGIVIVIENLGDNEIKWLKLSLNPRDKALVPLSSDSENVFKNLHQGGKKESRFWFSIEKDAQAKNYPVDIALSYMDERGEMYNETKLVGIVAAGRASLDIAKKTTEPARINENEPFILTLKIENTGTGDARGVSTYLESPLEGDTLSFLGEIKKDDYSNAIFTIDPVKSGKKTSNLTISYEDDFGKHEIKKEVILIVNPVQSENTIPIILGGVVSAFALFFWKRRKH